MASGSSGGRGYTEKALVGCGWVLVVPLLLVVLLRIFAHDAHMVLVWLNSATLYLYLPAYLVLVLALVSRKRVLAGMAALVALCHGLWVAPDLPLAWAVEDVPSEARLRLISANLLMINPDPSGIMDELQGADADVLLLQEYSPRWHEGLSQAGVHRAYPEGHWVVRQDSFGTAIFAKQPIEGGEVFDIGGLPMTRGSIDVSGRKVHIVNVHTLPPRRLDYTSTWNAQLAELVSMAESRTAPLVMIGDFNATQHSVWYRRITDAGLRDCHRDRGRGLATSFPNELAPVPQIRLDHVFVSDEIACLSVIEGVGKHSDHRPLVVELGLRQR